MKLLVVILALALLGWLLFGRSRKRRDAADQSPPRSTPPPHAPPLEGMVACAHCGVHLPASEAVKALGDVYCGSAHRELGPRPR